MMLLSTTTLLLVRQLELDECIRKEHHESVI